MDSGHMSSSYKARAILSWFEFPSFFLMKSTVTLAGLIEACKPILRLNILTYIILEEPFIWFQE